jgi:flagellar hook-associated protein FlgK
MSGLARSAKAAELVSENIANANKAGYAKRSLSLHGPTHAQGGLSINTIVRQDNGLLLGEHQLAAGNRAYAKLKAGFCLSPLELCQYILAKGVRKHGSKALI